MEIFTRVVQAGSFSAASRRLDVSKSVVSKHVTQLERSMGVRLLNRTTRSVSLTEIGRVFYEHCSAIMSAAEQAELAAVHFQAQPRGTLKLTAPVSFGVLHVAPAISRLLEMFPELCVETTLSDGAVNIVEDGFDAAIAIADELPPGLVARRLAPVRRRFCASPGYLDRHGIPTVPADLVSHNCLVFTGNGTRKKWCFRTTEGESHVQVKGNCYLNNENAIRQAALAGLGVAQLPTYLIGGDLQSGALRPLLVAYPPPEAGIYVVYPMNRHLSPKVRALVDFLVARFGAEPAWDQLA